MDSLKIAEGSNVAEIGAAGGWFTVRLARRVGPNGRVYAEDIQPQMIDVISRRVKRENLQNVVPVLGTQSDPRMPPGIDAESLLEAAVAEGVAYVTGAPFFVDGGGENTMRLTFAREDAPVIEEGVKRLARAVRARIS